MSDPELSGRYDVRAYEPALADVRKLFPRKRDAIALRRHALKLRYWPDRHAANERGEVLDLNWSWVKSLPGTKIGELRVGEVIAGHDNLRIIFFVGDPAIKEPLPMIWVIAAFQKKRDDFTKPQMRIFDLRRKLVIQRFYDLPRG